MEGFVEQTGVRARQGHLPSPNSPSGRRGPGPQYQVDVEHVVVSNSFLIRRPDIWTKELADKGFVGYHRQNPTVERAAKESGILIHVFAPSAGQPHLQRAHSGAI